jgi:hypothetical protein
MFDAWLQVLDRVLAPERPALARCFVERSRHLENRSESGASRRSALLRCEHRINEVRRDVFAADDGVVDARMTDLERQWRVLARADPEAGLMELWSRLVGPASIDRKRWRDETPGAWPDALVALASDEANVLAAEAALATLRGILARQGVVVPERVRFRFGRHDGPTARALLREAGRLSYERCPSDYRTVALERATELELCVQTSALSRFPDRPELACDLGYAAFVDCAWRAAGLEARENPVAPLIALWKTGYVIATLEDSAIILEIPALPAFTS